MNNLRFDALKKIAQQTSDRFNPNPNRLERFADHVLTDQKLSHYLSKTAFTEMTKASLSGQPISRSLAEQIAQSMKIWALDKGATHYTIGSNP